MLAQQISTGEEGYRVDGEVDGQYVNHAWVNNGLKGVDFVGNVNCPNISFATVHMCELCLLSFIAKHIFGLVWNSLEPGELSLNPNQPATSL